MESVFLALLVSVILIVFSKLGEVQRSQLNPYRFSQPKKEVNHVQKF